MTCGFISQDIPLLISEIERLRKILDENEIDY